MTTEITDIYTAFVTRLTALFPQHARMANVFDLEQNNEKILVKSWGLLLGGAGENTERHLSCGASVLRQVTVHFTREVVATEQNAATRGSSQATLLEDLQLLIDECEANFTLRTGKFIIKYVSDSGIIPVHTEKERYIGISATITAEYFRQV